MRGLVPALVLELVEIDFGEIGTNVLGVAVVDVLPSFFHAFDLWFGIVCKTAEESLSKFVRSGAGKHAGNVHIGIAGAGEAKINHANHLVIFIEEDVAEVEITVH